MHVGYGAAFQNPNNALSDAEVYRNEVRLAELAEFVEDEPHAVCGGARPARLDVAPAGLVPFERPTANLGRDHDLAWALAPELDRPFTRPA